MRYIFCFLLATGLLAQGGPNKKPDATWHECTASGQEANFSGYQSTAREFTCRQGLLRIEGKWGVDIQNGWEYHTEFGEPTGSVDYIGDLPEEMQMPKFQKWCKTPFGFTLCGWNEEEQKRQDRIKEIP